VEESVALARIEDDIASHALCFANWNARTVAAGTRMSLSPERTTVGGAAEDLCGAVARLQTGVSVQ
jgi:hypothetical protein